MVRVPDSVAGAAAGRGRRVAGVASLLDLHPTLVELAGIRHPRGDALHVGWSLAPALLARGGKPPAPSVPTGRALLAEVTMGPVALRSVRDGRWHLVRASAPPNRTAVALYDYVSDPGERRDAAEREPQVRTEQESRLDALFEAL